MDWRNANFTHSAKVAKQQVHREHTSGVMQSSDATCLGPCRK